MIALRRSIQVAVPALVVLVCVSDLLSPSQQSVPLWLYALNYIVPGAAFAIAGLVAWSLRPANHMGLLMMAVGVGLLIGAAGILTPVSPLARTISEFLRLRVGHPSDYLFLALGPLWAVVILHLLLAFPSGRLGARLSRGLVAALYVFVPLISLIGLSVPFEVGLGSWLQIGYTTVRSVVYQTCFAVGFVLIMKRWVQGGRARRRSLSPVLWSLAPLSVAFLTPTLEGVLQQVIGVPDAGPLVDSTNAVALASPLFLIVLPIGFLVGLLRSGLDMTSVASLVVRLSNGLLPEQLQPALAKALHDPSLEVAYWVPALESFADLNGRRVELPGPDSERAASILDGAASPVAALVYDSSLRHEPQLVETAAAAVRMALENAGLQAQLKAQLEEVRQSRARLVEAGQRERQQVERDLHDGAQQQLVALLLALQATRAEAAQYGDKRTAAMLGANIAALKQALVELRELARGIHPSILTEAGLVAAIQSLGERCPIPVQLDAEYSDRLPSHLEATLYFVTAEAITNAVKHSGGGRIQISLRRRSGIVALDVCDDGKGGADLAAGTGLRGLSDRVAAVGGQLTVKSHHAGGTTIHSEIPCA